MQDAVLIALANPLLFAIVKCREVVQTGDLFLDGFVYPFRLFLADGWRRRADYLSYPGYNRYGVSFRPSDFVRLVRALQ